MPSPTPEMPSADFVSSHECCGQVRRKDCIDIKKRFGRRFIIEYEDPAFVGSRCPWHRQIKARYGFIAPSGGPMLWVHGHGPAKNKLIALCETDNRFELQQREATAVSLRCNIADVDAVLPLIQAKRR